ncbi:MAG: transcriptional regulator [Bacteroidetes bacterium]|nr:MAG: transcriptional regulator [Bacteroidota bacterium]
MKTFAEIIRKARSDKKMILRQVASITDIDQSIINKFELAERKPSKEQVIKLAECYELDKNELIIAWKSDLVCYSLKDEELASEIIKVPEQKIKYAKTNE